MHEKFPILYRHFILLPFLGSIREIESHSGTSQSPVACQSQKHAAQNQNHDRPHDCDLSRSVPLGAAPYKSNHRAGFINQLKSNAHRTKTEDPVPSKVRRQFTSQCDPAWKVNPVDNFLIRSMELFVGLTMGKRRTIAGARSRKILELGYSHSHVFTTVKVKVSSSYIVKILTSDPFARTIVVYKQQCS